MQSYHRNWRQIVFPVLSLLSLSLAWLPPLQKRQVTPRSVPQRANYRAKKNLIYKNLDIETARWKAGAIAAFCKAVFTVCIAFAINNQLVSDENQPWTVLTKSIAWREHPVELENFLTNLCASFIGILVAYVTCKISLDVGAFGFPLFLSGLLCILILAIGDICGFFQTEQALSLVSSCKSKSDNITYTFIATICLILAEILASWYIILQADTNLLPKDSAIFLMPGYNGVMLEEWIVLNRHREPESSPIDFKERVKNSKIYICTTMYREADYEMKQLLESINRVNVAQFESIRHFESHVFFDGGVKGSKPTEFALQLLSLLPSTLDISPKNCRQLKTPYGICLKWKLPAPGGKNRMKFCIHLKDNLKVKNKKRWSQVMYMSYALDYLLKEQHVSENSEGFILTTDADVFFTPDSVEALLDLMTRDESVGAVCARTHPLGSGPLIWYQKFEYAIGHWFQKSAEDILGSVLCSPGCFSVYRCDAIMDVLPTYSTTVNEAFDFLIKDMGEDRWFCTLMLQNGWRIDYCAVATNSTHCPDGFDEFFKQRRRWIVSTIANLILVVKESRLMMKFNRHISVFFIIYQFVLLLATVIGPATVILVVSGGLQYGWSISPTYSIIIQYVCSALFIIICLSTSGDFQLKVAKIFTFIYAIIMTVVTIGTIVQVVDDLNKDYDPDSNIPPVSISDIYLFALIAIFVLSSLCHLQEITNLLNGVWYLLCLPTGYLVLIMYSICNLTDKSWGTREDSSASAGKETAFLKSCFNMLKSIFPCCRSGENKSGSGSIIQPPHTPTLLKPGGEDILSTSEIEVSITMDGDTKHDAVDGQLLPVEYGVKVIPVQEWLPDSFKDLYSKYFMRNGYDDTRLISGMHEKELVDIGIKSKGHRQYLMDMIKLLPDFEPDTEVPESALIWLQNIGLSMYQENFKRNCIIFRRDMAVLKTMSTFDIKRELKIIKKGHIKRLQLAIKKLLDPTEAERTKMQIKRDLSMTRMVNLEEENPVEDDFWKELVHECLDPSSAFSREDELKGKLGELRNNWTLVIAVSNTIWLVLLATMATQANLAVYSSNPLGFVFLAVFGFIFVLQFLCMLFHRMGTLMHLIARSPYKFGAGFKTSWSFSDKRLRRRNNQDRSDFETDITTGKRIRDFENSQRQLENVVFSP
ncbi:chitin synthase chs-2-like isoform X2 [Octopus sinensis]|uniref:chitin synthase n=1 Tax=Octopus sinensis TaxID=2607531 RepID=A0A6P7UAH5_9MOLL|nr:chitin synthase chs-2-like isoform X2 [Octopus sinensis]